MPNLNSLRRAGGALLNNSENIDCKVRHYLWQGGVGGVLVVTPSIPYKDLHLISRLLRHLTLSVFRSWQMKNTCE